MSNENLEKPYKQRFKGVENFLRRVAFNLGNTASQTEVKIISCIPIDVTDLQQKIINLEKQLHESRQRQENFTERNHIRKPSVPVVNTVNTVLCGPAFKQPTTVSNCSDKIKTQPAATNCGGCSSRKKSNVSFAFPPISAADAEQACYFGSQENSNLEDENLARIERYKNIFKKRKKKKVLKGKNKIKAQLVYYTRETPNNPFVNSVPLNKTEDSQCAVDDTCESYLENIMRRQYDPKYVIKEYSDTSHFSRPVCRDIKSNCRHQESDVCSCFHGKFQNIDNYMTNNTNFDFTDAIRPNSSASANKIYYDCNQYDIIPVKDNANYSIKEDIKLMTRGISKKVDIKCWPENFRTKFPRDPIIVNYETGIPATYHSSRKVPHKSVNAKEEFSSTKRLKKLGQQTGFETSKSGCVDCSAIYTKQVMSRAKNQKVRTSKIISHRNECIATEDNETKVKCNSQSTQLEINTSIDNKTESALNQIKTMLQSVLAEVKTSSNINPTYDEKQKKDAVVQKGASQNNMLGNSTLLHSFTYNHSCNANPYLASCSRQLPPGPYCYSNVPCQPMKCLQNFPVFVQAPGRQMCACYTHRHSSHKPSRNKQATAAATNTEKLVEKSSSKETEKLIKEIYKSMALNMDFPTKDNSASECEDVKSTGTNSMSHSFSTKEVKSIGIDVSNKKSVEIEALLSPLVSNTKESKLVYTAASTQSDVRKEPSDFFKPYRLLDRHSTDTIVEDNEESEEENNETDSDVTTFRNEPLIQDKKEKQGFFQRIFKSVKLLKKRKDTPKSKIVIEEESDTSDSDDYQTVYSDKSNKIPTRRNQLRHRRVNYPKSNVKYQKPGINPRFKRSPYMEQEYRRQWNENLMFHEPQDNRYSSGQTIARQSNLKQAPQPVYWNNYEARSAILDDNQPNALNNVSIPNKKEQGTSKPMEYDEPDTREKTGWLKKHKFGIHCGEQWKKFILES